MRISIILIIFLVLFNGWAALMMEYDIDDHLGFSAEVGDASDLEEARQDSKKVTTGEPLGQTLLGFYNGLLTTLKDVLFALNPGAQMLTNIVPGGPAQDVIVWVFTVIDFIILADVLAYARGVDL